MAQTTLNVRIDEDIKHRFDSFCTEVGMNTSVAVNLFIKAVLRERRIPFEIAAPEDPFYSEANQARLRRSIERLDAGQGVLHDLIEDEDG